MSELEIYYFSGTGNSLVVARDVALRTNAKLIPIPSVISQNSINTSAEAIGIVFPVYYETYGGIPLIICRFIKKLEYTRIKYLFAICTYGSGSIVTLNRLGNIIRSFGGKLDAALTVNMPENVSGSQHNNPEMQKRMFDTWKESIERVSEYINCRKKGKFNTPNVMVGRLWGFAKIIGIPALRLAKHRTLSCLQKGSTSTFTSYNELLPLMDNSFRTNSECNGCGICFRICPVANIQIVDNKPLWRHHCEFCLACFHWCPKQAIDSTVFPITVKYHHPDVTLTDMIHSSIRSNSI